MLIFFARATFAGIVDCQVIALSGSTVPGADGQPFRAVYWPVINNTGQIAYSAYVDTGSPTTVHDNWILGGTIGSPSVIARPGQAIPGVNSPWDIISNQGYQFNDAGQILLGGKLSDGRSVIALGPPGAIATVAVQGQSVAGSDGLPFDFLSFQRMSNTGFVSFASRLTDGSNTDYAPGLTTSSGTIVAAHTGSQVPGYPAGTTFGDLGTRIGGISVPDATGRLVFSLPYKNSQTQGSGLFMYSTGSVTQIQTGPLSSPVIGEPALNSQGQIAFASGDTSFPSNINFLHQIYVGVPGSFSLVAGQGMPAPGINGATFSDFDNPIIGDNGQVLFRARANGITGIWESTGAGLKLIAYNGEPGTTFAHLDSSDMAIEINASGQVAFGDGSASSSSSIWATNPAGSLVRIAAVGDQIDVGGGVLKTIAGLAMSQNFNGEFGGTGASAFNDASLLAFSATFSDGSDAVLLTSVPQPATLPLLAMVAPVLLGRSRKIARR